MRQYWTFVILAVLVSIILMMFMTGRPVLQKILGGMWQGNAKPVAEANADSMPELAEERSVASRPVTTPLYEALTSAPQR